MKPYTKDFWKPGAELERKKFRAENGSDAVEEIELLYMTFQIEINKLHARLDGK
jgi:predicted  nucleic acid-binding Zn-ribbon protein